MTVPKINRTSREKPIVAIGEILWDALPDGLFLGGAPFNVMRHLKALGHLTHFVSRIGKDELGREISHQFQQRNLDARYLQLDHELATGFVRVALDAQGVPAFDILSPSAWDNFQINDELIELARGSRAIIFGTLAQRECQSRQAIQRLIQEAPLAAYDINLRPPHFHRETIEQSLRLSKIVKLNDDELESLTKIFGLSEGSGANYPEARSRSLAKTFDCPTVCLTRGADGACLLHEGVWTEDPGFHVDVVDTVGSGDAFFARMLNGLLNGESPTESLRAANALGAFVASCPGATPTHSADAIAAIMLQR